MPELIFFIAYCIKLYMWVFIVDVLLNWLVSLYIVNTRNQFVYMIGTAVSRLTSPVLQPIRRRMPDLGGVDISPIVAILGLVFLRDVVLLGWLMPFVAG